MPSYRPLFDIVFFSLISLDQCLALFALPASLRLPLVLLFVVMSSPLFLVTGATGKTGGHAVNALLRAKQRVRVLVRKEDERSDKLRAAGAEIAIGDLTDHKTVRAALEGVYGAYFVYPIQPGLVEATANFAQAALEAGVSCVVNMSQISARQEARSHSAYNHWISERVLDWSGLSVTHLRPTFFSEWFLAQAAGVKSGVVRLPFTTGRHAPIAAEDQGRVIAALLLDPKPHRGQVYKLVGPEEMTFAEGFKRLGAAVGRDVRYESCTADEFRQSQWARSVNNSFLVEHLVCVAQDHTDGVFSGPNNLVEELTGTKPMTVEEFAVKHRAAFQ
jgi:NAD(P)H dehydrogenase (quinone)